MKKFCFFHAGQVAEDGSLVQFQIGCKLGDIHFKRHVVAKEHKHGLQFSGIGRIHTIVFRHFLLNDKVDHIFDPAVVIIFIPIKKGIVTILETEILPEGERLTSLLQVGYLWTSSRNRCLPPIR